MALNGISNARSRPTRRRNACGGHQRSGLYRRYAGITLLATLLLALSLQSAGAQSAADCRITAIRMYCTMVLTALSAKASAAGETELANKLLKRIDDDFGQYKERKGNDDVNAAFVSRAVKDLSQHGNRTVMRCIGADMPALQKVISAAEEACQANPPREEKNEPAAALSVTDAPKEQRSTLTRLLNKEPIELDRANTPFLSGLATGLVQRCSAPQSPVDRLALQKWAAAGLTSGVFGTDYSNPDLGKAIGNKARGNLSMAAGARLARKVPCGVIANRIAEGILDAVRKMEGRRRSGDTVFVSTCSHRHGKTKCECLAGVLRGTMPNIHRSPYSQGIIQQAIKRNPMTGFMAIACGIVRY